MSLQLVQHQTIESGLEPFHGFGSGHFLSISICATSCSSTCGSSSLSAEDNVEVHTEDTSVWVVFHAKIDVFLNTETEVASFSEVSFAEFEFFHLETTFKEFSCLIATDGDSGGNLFITLDGE